MARLDRKRTGASDAGPTLGGTHRGSSESRFSEFDGAHGHDPDDGSHV
jgi:hypothetical protein